MWISSEKRFDELVALKLDNLRREYDQKLKDLEQNFLVTTDLLTDRIKELEHSYRRGSLKSDEPESVQIDPGHVPFSQRKKNFEAQKRQEGLKKRQPPQAAKGT